MRKLLKKTLAISGCVAMMASMTACGAKPETQPEATRQTEATMQTEATAETEGQAVKEGDAMAVNYGNMKDVSIKIEPIELTEEWDKVFQLSDEVNHRKVTFANHFGITLAADLYEPMEYTGKLPAIAVCGPFGAVKEQSSGLYAQELAKRGFLAIAFDPSFTGESAGYPRDFNSPDINIEDYQAVIDFLSIQENVDPEKIGIIGICGWGGMAVQTAALDTRIKATAAMTMYDMSRNTALGYFDSVDEEGRYEARIAYNRQRTEDYKNGSYTMGGGLPEEAPEEAPQYVKDYVAYYKTERGYHPRSVNANNGSGRPAVICIDRARLSSPFRQCKYRRGGHCRRFSDEYASV